MTVVTDDFNRPDEDLVDNANWVDPGLHLPWVEVIDNQITSDANAVRSLMWNNGGNWGRHQSAQLEVGADHVNNGGQLGGPAVYMSTEGCYTIMGFFNSGDPDEEQFRLVKYSNGGDSLEILADSPTADRADVVFTPGDILKLEAEDDGNGDTLLTVYRNGSVFYTDVDSDSPLTSGVPGVTAADINTRFDNFEADDFASEISDDFSRANQDLDSSDDWGDPGMFSEELVISSNQVTGSQDGSDHLSEWEGDGSWGTHQQSEVVVGGDNLAEGMGGPAVFINSNGFYWGGPDYANGEYRIMRYDVDTSSHTIVANVAWGSAPTSGTTITLEVEMVSGEPNLSLSVDASQVTSGNDTGSSPHTGGDVGIYILSDGIHFSSWSGDDFGGVTITPGVPSEVDAVGARCDVVVDADDGTIYAVATTSSTTPEIAQVKAGNDHNGSSAPYSASTAFDSPSFHAESLSTATMYWFHFMHEGSGGGQSSVVTSSSFTTTGASVTFTITDKDDTVVGNETGVAWWARPDRSSAATDSGASETTNASGEISIDIPNSTKTSGETVVVDVVLDDGRYGVFEATVD